MRGIVSFLWELACKRGGPAGKLLHLLLLPFALVYAPLLRISMARRRSLPPFPRPIPVIIVGNITVGGTGKTPLAARFVGWLSASGFKPAVVSRGYGGRRRADPAVVASGAAVLMSAREAGDEPVMLATRLVPGTTVVVGRDRVAAAEMAAGLGADALVLDDGFQQRGRFPGAFRVVAVNAVNPFGNGALLPAGILREPVGALAEADAIILTHADEVSAEKLARVRDVCGKLASRPVFAAAGWRFEGLESIAGGEAGAALQGRKVLAMSAIGYPGGFERMLERESGSPVVSMRRPDHHYWTAKEVSAAPEAARALGCDIVATTWKDYMKMEGLLPPVAAVPMAVVRAGMVLVAGEPEMGKALSGYLSAFHRG